MSSYTPIDESEVNRRVKKIVRERGSKWMPDAVEERLYANAIMALLGILDAAVSDLCVTFMGHRLKMDVETCDKACGEDPPSDDDMVLRSGKQVKRPVAVVNV